jgi:hypothetical protein
MFDPETSIGADYSILSGMDTIVGAEAIVGAVLAQGGSLEQALAAAKQADPSAVAVRNEGYTKNRRKILPCPATSIAAGAEASISIEPQELFKAKRFVVESVNATDFVITGISVATENQFSAEGEVPAEVFKPDAVDCYLDLKTAGPGVKIAVRVKNQTAGTLTFRAVFLGTSVS